MWAFLEPTKKRAEQYKIFQCLSVETVQYKSKCDEHINNLNKDSGALTRVIKDLSSDIEPLRHGSSYFLGRLIRESSRLELSADQRTDIITSMVNSLNVTKSSQEACQLMWSIRRDSLVSCDQMRPHIVTLLNACQRAVTDIKSNTFAARGSLGVAAGVLQLISKLYQSQRECMNENTRLWFSLVLSYCAHQESDTFRTYSQEIIVMAYDHLTQHGSQVRSIVSDVSENVVANITYILNERGNVSEGHKIFGIRLWALLVTIMGPELENVYTTNLYLSALCKAFSKSYPKRQSEAFLAWKTLIENFSIDYLLKPGVLNQLTVPLTKSNRVEESESLLARVRTWWSLITRLGNKIDRHFIKICKPLLEFCFSTSVSANTLINGAPRSVGKAKTSPPNLLQLECLAIMLQFLGEAQTDVVPFLQLSEEQRTFVLTKSSIRQSRKVFLQAIQESVIYLSKYPLLSKRYFPSLIKAYTALISRIITDCTSSENEDEKVRDVAIEMFSLVISTKSKIDPIHMVDFIEPLIELRGDILTSTAYTPTTHTDLNCFMKTPALCLLETLCGSVKGLDVIDNELLTRMSSCLCGLIEKGCCRGQPELALSFLEKSLSALNAIKSVVTQPPVDTQLINCLIKSLNICSPTKEDEAECLESTIAISQQVIKLFCQSELALVICSFSDRLSEILKLGSSHRKEAVSIWELICDSLRVSDQCGQVTSLHVFTELFKLSLLLEDTRSPTVALWNDTLSKRSNVSVSLRSAITPYIGQSEKSEGVPKIPTEFSTTNENVSTDTTFRSQSPPRSANPRQRVLVGSPRGVTIATSPSRRKGKRKHPEGERVVNESGSYHLLQGLLTPEKRQKISETTPDKAPETISLTSVNPADITPSPSPSPPPTPLELPQSTKNTHQTKKGTPTMRKATPLTKVATPTAESKGSAQKYKFRRTPSIINSGGSKKSGVGKKSHSKAKPEVSDAVAADNEELATPLSQSIENSPPPSQLISQFEETPVSQLISQPHDIDTAPAVEPLTQGVTASATPQNKHLSQNVMTSDTPRQKTGRITPATPGFPVTSPLCQISDNTKTVLSENPTPIKFTTTPENDDETAGSVKLTPCSVKLLIEKFPDNIEIDNQRSRTYSDASSISQVSSQANIDSQATIMDSQSTVIDSLLPGTPSSQTGQRRSRRSKVIKRLNVIQGTDSPKSSQQHGEHFNSESLSQSSQSLLSQSSSRAGTPKSRRTKKTDPEVITHSCSVDIQISAVNFVVRMVKNKTTKIIKCDGVQTLKSIKSRRVVKTSIDEDLCSSQELSQSQGLSQGVSQGLSQGVSQGFSMGVDQGVSQGMSQAQLIDPLPHDQLGSDAEIKKLHSIDNDNTTVTEPADGMSSVKDTKQDEEKMFDSISTHDSFFDEASGTVPTLEINKILGSASLTTPASLQFSSVELSPTSHKEEASGQSDTVSIPSGQSDTTSIPSGQSETTPIPPRLPGSEESISTVTSSGSQCDDRDSVEKCDRKEQIKSPIHKSTPNEEEPITKPSSSKDVPLSSVSRGKKWRPRSGRKKRKAAEAEDNSELNRSLTEMEMATNIATDEANDNTAKNEDVVEDVNSIEVKADSDHKADDLKSAEQDKQVSADELMNSSLEIEPEDEKNTPTTAVVSVLSQLSTTPETKEKCESLNTKTSVENVTDDITVMNQAEVTLNTEQEKTNAQEIVDNELTAAAPTVAFDDVGMSQFDEEMEITPSNPDSSKQSDNVGDDKVDGTEDVCEQNKTGSDTAVEVDSKEKDIPVNASETAQNPQTEHDTCTDNSNSNGHMENVQLQSISEPSTSNSTVTVTTRACKAEPTDVSFSVETNMSAGISSTGNSSTNSTTPSVSGILTPVRPDRELVKSSKATFTPSPSRAQKSLSLSLSNRGARILQKAMASKSPQVSSPGGMNHVDTLPATPKSRKLNVEALELDCTPIYSPSTGSILKRKRCDRSPPDNNDKPKKVKFNLPENDGAVNKTPGSERKLQKRTKSSKDGAILAMYSNGASTTELEISTTNDNGSQESSSENTSSESQALSQKDPPIASEYTDSETPIADMVAYLASVTWQGNLKQCLISQGISTVGAMALLTEADIELLPIKTPKLSTALKAFKKSGATKNSSQSTNARINNTVSLKTKENAKTTTPTRSSSSLASSQEVTTAAQESESINMHSNTSKDLTATNSHAAICSIDNAAVETPGSALETPETPSLSNTNSEGGMSATLMSNTNSQGGISATQLEAIMKLVTDREMTNSQLGSEIRSLLVNDDP